MVRKQIGEKKMQLTPYQLSEMFLATKGTEGKSRNTIIWYKQMLNHYFEFLGRGSTLKDININTARDFIASMQARTVRYEDHPVSKAVKGSLSPHTIHGFVRTLRVFSSWMAEEGYTSTDVLQKLKRPKLPETMVEVLSDEEIGLILKHINPSTFLGARLYAVVLLLLDTGIRATELLTLTLENLNMQDNRIKVMGKGRKERIVPFGLSTKKALMRYMSLYRPETSSTCVFVNTEGQPLSYTALSHILMRIGERAGVPRLHAHLLRHTFAVKYLLNGGDMMTLRLLLGHTTISTTQLYLHLAEQHITVRYHQFSPVDHLADIKI